MSHNPSFETFFGKFLIEDQRALWFRYTRTKVQPSLVTLWGIFFDEQSVLIQKECVEKSQIVFSFDEYRASGKAGDVGWDLVFKDSGKRFSPVPVWMKRLPFMQSHYESVGTDLEFSGSVFFAGHEFVVHKTPGMIGRVWGNQLPVSWVWGHCNEFTNIKDVIFEGISSRIKIGGFVFPAQTTFILEVEGRRYEFSSLSFFSRVRSESTDSSWKFYGKNCVAEVSGEIVLPQVNQVAQLELSDTNGSLRTNHNSALCDLVIHFRDRKTGQERECVARRTAMFEVVK